jgi:hypothetical protein
MAGSLPHRITATATASDDKVWTSSARFTATPAGTLSLAQASHCGSYTGAQAMGLFVYMKPPAGHTTDGYFTLPATGFDVRLQTSVAGRAVASSVTHRQQQIRGPIFLTCGGEDRVWLSCLYTGEIAQALSSSHFAYPVTSLDYASAGHFGAQPRGYTSETAAYLDQPGGNQADNEQAMADGYPRLLKFLAAQ